MQFVRTALLLLLTCSTACSWKADQDPYAAPPHRKAPYPKATDQVPLGNVPPPSQVAPPGPGEVKVDLEPMGEGHARGTADLREVDEGVRVSLQLRRGEPGTARLAVEERDCHRLPAAHPPSAGELRGAKGSVIPGPNKPGEIEVKENGQAVFTTTLPHTNLQPRARGSLLGKALVVYESRAIRAAHTSEEPVACAMVRRK